MNKKKKQIGAICVASAQIHVSDFCNLKCKHCYSSSSPNGNNSLNLNEIKKFINFIVKEEYKYLSFSGGEPLLYENLIESIEFAIKKGLKVGLVTNGTLLDEEKASQISKLIGSIAISIDGPELLHNQIRNRSSAFKKALTGIKTAQDCGLNVGIIHTLTKDSLPHIGWLVDFCELHNISNLQIHPLELTGFAKEELKNKESKRELCSQAFIALQLMNPKIPWQIDTFNREIVKDNYNLLGIIDDIENREILLSQLINPIILTQEGNLLPYQYSVNEKYRISHISSDYFYQEIEDFTEKKFPEIQKILKNLLPSVLDKNKLPYFNWYSIVSESLK